MARIPVHEYVAHPSGLCHATIADTFVGTNVPNGSRFGCNLPQGHPFHAAPVLSPFVRRALAHELPGKVVSR
jgi:hypothetical protein